jgi:U3 small nucleolar RNA-associated protein 15
MEAEAGEYKRLDIKQYAPRSIRETAENKFWKKFKAPVVAKQAS